MIFRMYGSRKKSRPEILSNDTVVAYQGTVGRIKQFPIGSRKLKSITSEHLQAFFDLLSGSSTLFRIVC